MTWIRTNGLAFSLIVVLVIVLLVFALMVTGRLQFATAQAPAPAPAVDLGSLEAKLESQTEAINNLVAALAAEPAAPAPEPEEEDTPAVPPGIETTLDECLPGGVTTEQAQALTGVLVERVATECSSFVWRGANEAAVEAVCPSGWICTWDVVGDVVVVHEGIGQKSRILAGTFREIAAYPADDAVHDVCRLYNKEKALGLNDVPSFEVRFQPVPGGIQQCS